MLIIYGDGGEGIENGKLRNISLHVLYTSLVSVCTLPFNSTAFSYRSGYSSVTGCVLTQAIRPALQNLEYF